LRAEIHDEFEYGVSWFWATYTVFI
jgi:hypothetical protein